VLLILLFHVNAVIWQLKQIKVEVTESWVCWSDLPTNFFLPCDRPADFFSTKDEQKVEHKTIFKTQKFTCTCKISYGRGNRTL